MDHPNCQWLHEIINSPFEDHLHLVTEFHANGSIADLIEKENEDENMSRSGRGSISNGLKNSTCRSFMIDLLKALHYCHNKVKITHRDIKPENIMINHNNEAVLINFGLSALLKDK